MSLHPYMGVWGVSKSMCGNVITSEWECLSPYMEMRASLSGCVFESIYENVQKSEWVLLYGHRWKCGHVLVNI